MKIQYNVAVKVLNPFQEWRIQQSLQNYTVFTNKSGYLEDTCFSKEDIPYVGELVVVKTLKKDAAKTAHHVLSGIEGLVVMPITECDWEEDKKRVATKIQERAISRT